MRWFLLLPCLLVLAACDVAVSRRPLVVSGGEQPLPGLWALLEPGCPQPSGGAVGSWSKCATPVWVQPGEATVVGSSPVRKVFVVGAGEPRILQVETRTGEDEPVFSYWALRTEGPLPSRSATLWVVACEADRGRTGAAVEDGECLVEDAAELQRLARAAVSEEPVGRAAYIGPR